MTDILLSYDDETALGFVQAVKADIEKAFNFSVSLKGSTNEWEESGEFLTNLNKEARELVVLENNNTTISVWIMIDCRTKTNSRNGTMPKMPPSIDFSKDYEEGIEILSLVLEGKLL